MKRFIFSGFLALFALVGFSPAFTQAAPYLLTVQQLKATMDKARQTNQKGFVLVDVRSPEEHQGHCCNRRCRAFFGWRIIEE